MKTLLIGSSGNLGSAILKKANFDITAFTRDDWINDNDFLFEDIDLVIHAAADHRVRIADNVGKYVSSNIGITSYVLEKMKLFNIKKIYYMSSCAVYGGLMCPKESDPIGPITLNGYMKAANEFLVDSFCSTNSIDFQICRIFNLYGGTDRFSFVSKLISSAQSNSSLRVCNEGMSQRDYIHVYDVAEIILILVHKNTCVKYLNIGSGFTTKIIEIVNAARAQCQTLCIEYIQGPKEVEYIRADLSQLKKHIGSYPFKNVIDYIKEQLS